MLFLLSPAKSLDYETPLPTTLAHSQPLFTKQSAALIKVLRQQSPQQIAALMQVAQASGLEWVNSDADKVAAVQAAIAAEPKPVHVPRQRPPAVVLDEGPLVLVETRRDLRELQLPFEKEGAAV